MADASDVYKQGDVMDKLQDNMAQMVVDQQKMVDPDYKPDVDSEEEASSDEENHQANEYTFEGAIDVGSHFIDVNPEDQLQFNNYEGTLMTQFNISNPCKHCYIAFYVYTSAPIPITIKPNCGFIPATFTQPIKIFWEKGHNPNVAKLNNCMFFVKALPLSPNMQIDAMNNQLAKVFNTYNQNILFCTHHLPCKVVENQFNPQQMQQMQARQQQLQAQQQQQQQQQIQKNQAPPPTQGQQQQQVKPSQVAPQQAMTAEIWAKMTPEQQKAFQAQQQQQRPVQAAPQPAMTAEIWAKMTPEQQNAFKAQQQQQQQVKTSIN